MEVKIERGIEEEKIKEGIREIRCKGEGEGKNEGMGKGKMKKEGLGRKS